MASVHPQDYLEMLAIQEDAVFPYEVSLINSLPREKLQEWIEKAYRDEHYENVPLLTQYEAEGCLMTRDAVFPQFYREFACIWDKSCGNVDLMRLRLRGPLTIDIINSEDRVTGRSILHLATIFGTVTDVETILAAGANINATDKGGDSALIVAVWASKTDVVRLLVQAGANVNICDRRGRSPLMLASANNDLGIMDCLLSARASLDAVSKYGWTALMFACKRGQEDAVAVLLAAGADVGVSLAPNHLSALTLASMFCRVNIVRLLVAVRADLDHRDVNNATSLHYACHNGATDIVRTLLEADARPWLRNNLGETPLFLAVRSSHMNIIKLLLLTRLNREQQIETQRAQTKASQDTNNAAHGSATASDSSSLSANDQKRLVREKKQNRLRETLMNRIQGMLKEKYGNISQLLALATSIDPNSTVVSERRNNTSDNSNPGDANELDFPVLDLVHRIDRFAETAERGDNLRDEAHNVYFYPNTVNSYGVSPLMVAVERGDYDIVNLLLHARASIDLMDIEGRTVFDYAQMKKKDSIIDLLEAAKLKRKEEEKKLMVEFGNLFEAHDKVVDCVLSALRNNHINVSDRADF